MAKIDNNRPAATDEDRKKYQEAWAEMMVTIWREKIERLHVINTYSLHQQIRDNVISSTDSVSTIQHKFLEYGIYQERDLSVVSSKPGGYYTSGNPRKPREWFSRPYFASIMVLKEQMAYMYGEEFCGLLVDKIEEANHKRSTTLKSRLYGTRKRK